MKLLVFLTACAAAAVAAALPARAQQAVPDYATVCNANSFFGLPTGRIPEGSPVPDRWTNLPAGFGPFDHGQAIVASWTRQLGTLTAMADLDDRAAAQALYDAIRSRFVEAGRTIRPGSGYSIGGVSAPPQPNEFHLYLDATAANAAPQTGIRITVTRMSKSVWFTCIDQPAQAASEREFMGAVPEGAPKPVLPPVPDLSRVTATRDCADPAQRQAIAADLRGAFEPILTYGHTVSDRTALLMHWKADRMIRSGAWTRDESGDFLLNLARGPEASSIELLPAAILSLIATTGRMEDAAPGSPEQCALAAQAGRYARIMVAAAQEQWRAIGNVYDAEARRRGVRLE